VFVCREGTYVPLCHNPAIWHGKGGLVGIADGGVVVTLSFNALGKGAGTLAVSLAFAGDALAQQAQTPSISGNSWVAIGIILALVVLILFFIRSAIRVSEVDDTADSEDEGVGVFEGIEEDDPKPKKRK
jgi:hypothetical protein